MIEGSTSASLAPSQRTEHPAPNQVLFAAYEAALAVASELDLDKVLQRLVDLARQVVPAKYAALGVADSEGRIVQFLTSGISDEVRAAIGPIPQGHGLIGVLIHERKTLRVPDISKDPRSAGFPAHHPPMRSLLGVPILLGDRVLGDLYLTERLERSEFTEEDEAAVQVLAAHAASAIERAQLHREVSEGSRQATEQRNQLQSIIENLPSGVLILTAPDGAIELANSTALHLLFGESDTGGRLPVHGRDYRLLKADGSPLPTEQLPGYRALRGETARNRNFLLERNDGTRVPVLTQATPIRDRSGAIARAVVVHQDVTRLREAEQLKDDFLSLVSHEFRTPLTAIHGGAFLLAKQGESLDEETRQELLHDIFAESERLDRMLANMLAVAAIMAGRLEASTEPVLVAPLVRTAADDVAGRTPDHTFTFDLPDGLPPIEGDPQLLDQVLRNLYENAVKYSPGAGEICTAAEREGDRVRILVTDQGVGIAPEHVPHVFERFRRPGADPTVRGMGLGLYLSRLLIEAQGGRISASSPGAGLGATFAIELPVATGWDGAA